MPGGTGTICRTGLIDDAVTGEGLALAGHDQAVRALDGQAARRLEGLAAFLIGLAEFREQPLGIVEQPGDDRLRNTAGRRGPRHTSGRARRVRPSRSGGRATRACRYRDEGSMAVAAGGSSPRSTSRARPSASASRNSNAAKSAIPPSLVGQGIDLAAEARNRRPIRSPWRAASCHQGPASAACAGKPWRRSCVLR